MPRNLLSPSQSRRWSETSKAKNGYCRTCSSANGTFPIVSATPTVLLHRWTLTSHCLLRGMPTSYYRCWTANIRIKSFPDKLYNQLRRFAREQECTLDDIILEAIEREVSRREWHKRFSRRPSTKFRISAAELLEQERRRRDSASG